MCGDAHVSNFGFYGSPERRLVFDANDFDETLPGPVRVRRQAAGGQPRGRRPGERATRASSARAIAVAAGRPVPHGDGGVRRRLATSTSGTPASTPTSYRQRLAPLLDAGRAEAARPRARQGADAGHPAGVRQAHRGRSTADCSIRADPPLVVPLRDLLPESERNGISQHGVPELIRQYRTSLQSDRRTLLERLPLRRHGPEGRRRRQRRHAVLDRPAHRPGRRRPVAAAGQGGDARRCTRSSSGTSRYTNQGQRVVTGQRLDAAGERHVPRLAAHDRDRRRRARLLRPPAAGLEGVARPSRSCGRRAWQIYGEVCAWSLARAHARSGDRIAIAGYLGSSPTFDNALAEFAETYADVNEGDHRQLADAVADGRVPAIARHMSADT